jgi:hypothetical protein
LVQFGRKGETLVVGVKAMFCEMATGVSAAASGTISFDDSLCPLSINSVGQTRSLTAASKLPLDVSVTVVADTIMNSGTCTLSAFMVRVSIIPAAT